MQLRQAVSGVVLAGRIAASAASDRPLRLCVGGRFCDVLVDAVGGDWFTGTTHQRVRLVIPFWAVDALEAPERRDDMADLARVPRSAVVTFGMVLSDLARRRLSLDLDTKGIRRHGTLNGAWSDHCELAVHPVGGVPRRGEIRERLYVPYSAVRHLSLVEPGE